eukprot:scaffold652149_cov42-Prasinocladus_malaysianus.AAC.1
MASGLERAPSLIGEPSKFISEPKVKLDAAPGSSIGRSMITLFFLGAETPRFMERFSSPCWSLRVGDADATSH